MAIITYLTAVLTGEMRMPGNHFLQTHPGCMLAYDLNPGKFLTTFACH